VGSGRLPRFADETSRRPRHRDRRARYARDRRSLEQRGYAPVPRPDTRAWNFVLGDDAGHQIDFHVIVFDEHGRGVYGPASNAESYPAEALAGTGTVNGRTVVCITPEWLVRFHTGYEVDATDPADVSALCERFGIPIPASTGEGTATAAESGPGRSD
jgi:lincosamide nucleotidyltransferase A/C/D/E